ncbi:MAG: 3-phosphoshikimate 1-carboxyvinyltransferase [Clostridiales bacterium]|nr:3-phosphoshikimate 1-carboxyvinyltransferase [Clostridiales bacterium]
MDIKITPTVLSGEIDAISSKSDIHRALICAAFSDKPTRIFIHGDISDDVLSTINCLKAMGAEITSESDNIFVIPVKKPGGEITLDCGESGSTLRFILPVAAAAGDDFTVTGRGRLPDRPILPLISLLREHGCIVSSDKIPCSSQGKLQGGKFETAGNISSQFISGLLMAFPLLSEGGTVVLTSPLMSSGYVDMTIGTMKKFGVTAQKSDGIYSVPGGQKYSSDGEYFAEGDWSNASFWLCAGALSGGIVCRGLDAFSFQKDRTVADIIEGAGAKISKDENSLRVEPSDSLLPFEADASEIPDAVPCLSVLAAGAVGTSRIYNIERLRLKESDRVMSVFKMMRSLGADIKLSENAFVINGKGRLSGGTVDSFNDHRIAMAAAVASVICENEVVIKDAGCVKKSYPGFFKDLNMLGGKTDVV